jgi:pyruvate/2-oxoglutarate/acetoin dehydrogenase E1 component
MDYETILTSVKKQNSLVVLEEAWPFASRFRDYYIVQERAFDFLMRQFNVLQLLILQHLILQFY